MTIVIVMTLLSLADTVTLILQPRTWTADIRLYGFFCYTSRRPAESFSLLRKGCWTRRYVDSRVTVVIMHDDASVPWLHAAVACAAHRVPSMRCTQLRLCSA